MSYCRLSISAFQLVANGEVPSLMIGNLGLIPSFSARFIVIDRSFLTEIEYGQSNTNLEVLPTSEQNRPIDFANR